MGVAVLIPFGGVCPDRQAGLDWVLDQYAEQHPGWPVHIGRHDGPWCKAAAVADALERCDADVLVIADADVWCAGIDVAVDNCATWAVPHGLVHRLTAAATAELIDTGVPGLERAEKPYRGHAGGGIVVVRRDVYEHCPLDRRFVGWGHEDDSWALALTTLHGRPWRGDVDLWHLWHPPQERPSRRQGSQESVRLHSKYRNARTVKLMEGVLDGTR